MFYFIDKYNENQYWIVSIICDCEKIFYSEYYIHFVTKKKAHI